MWTVVGGIFVWTVIGGIFVWTVVGGIFVWTVACRLFSAVCRSSAGCFPLPAGRLSAAFRCQPAVRMSVIFRCLPFVSQLFSAVCRSPAGCFPLPAVRPVAPWILASSPWPSLGYPSCTRTPPPLSSAVASGRTSSPLDQLPGRRPLGTGIQ